jgi:hypothetical protein
MSGDPDSEGTVGLGWHPGPIARTAGYLVGNRRRTVPLLKRLALMVSIVFCGSLALAAAALAAGGGLAPGAYVFTSTSADATVGIGKGGPPGQQGFSVFVNRGLNSYQPEAGKGQRTVTNSTMVQLSIFSATGTTFGCFTIDPSNFIVSKNLQSASLRTTLTTANMCPGVGAPVTGKSDVAPPAGNVGGIPLPITIDLTWTGLGVTATTRDRSSFDCLDYSTQSTYVSHTSGAIASGTVSALTGAFKADVAGVSSTDTRLDISGTPNPACFSF